MKNRAGTGVAATGRVCWIVMLAVLAGILGSGRAWGWHGPGHQVICRMAVGQLGEELPAFLREGGAVIADASLDPDIFKKPLAGQALHDDEYPEHFIDLELLKGCSLPGRREDFIRLCRDMKVEASEVGMVPWTILAGEQRLAVCLAEYRKWPENRMIQTRCLIYAGLMAHYAQDLCQPLHTTVNYDGIRQADGSRRYRGIHRKVDALAGKLADPNGIVVAEVKAGQDVFELIKRQLKWSHAQVEVLYGIADEIPGADEALVVGSAPERFARECAGRAAQFTRQLIEASWRESETIVIPVWHHR